MLYDHTTTPPTPHAPPCLIRGIGVSSSTPAENLPDGVYPDGGSVAIPNGYYATSSERVVRAGMSVVEHMVAPIPVTIPSLTARQLRLWLLGAGVGLVTIDSMIAEIPDAAQRAAAQVEWEYASEYKRNHHLVVQIGAALGLTAAQIDAAFIAAAKL